MGGTGSGRERCWEPGLHRPSVHGDDLDDARDPRRRRARHAGPVRGERHRPRAGARRAHRDRDIDDARDAGEHDHPGRRVQRSGRALRRQIPESRRAYRAADADGRPARQRALTQEVGRPSSLAGVTPSLRRRPEGPAGSGTASVTRAPERRRRRQERCRRRRRSSEDEPRRLAPPARGARDRECRAGNNSSARAPIGRPGESAKGSSTRKACGSRDSADRTGWTNMKSPKGPRFCDVVGRLFRADRGALIRQPRWVPGSRSRTPQPSPRARRPETRKAPATCVTGALGFGWDLVEDTLSSRRSGPRHRQVGQPHAR
jgi:hypothetical protein